MTAEKIPVLYSFRRCPYAMRARMAVFVSGLPVELREVVLRNKPAAMLEASPKGTVPVLVQADGTVIDESLDIMLWALGKNDPAGWLRHGVGGLDEMLSLIRICDDDFKHHLDRYKYASRYEGAVAQDHRQEAMRFLLLLEEQLRFSACLYGDAPTLADYAVMPFVRQFANTDKSWFDEAPLGFVQKWLLELLNASPFQDIMSKYEAWHEGAGPIYLNPVGDI